MTHGQRNELLPSWSLDGSSLFFGNIPPDTGVPPSAIYHLNLKSHQLTTVSGSEGMWFPRLSPDNDYIAALTNINHLLLDVKTQKWTELTHTAAYYPAWSGRAKAMNGDKAKARKSYQEFFASPIPTSHPEGSQGGVREVGVSGANDAV